MAASIHSGVAGSLRVRLPVACGITLMIAGAVGNITAPPNPLALKGSWQLGTSTINTSINA